MINFGACALGGSEMNNEVSPEEKARLQRQKDFRPWSIVKEEIMCKCEEKEEAPNTGKFEIVWSRENIAEVLIVDGYEPLATVLIEALFQSQLGKGKKCHANGKPFMEQPIITGGRECGPGGLAFQARKKILEALNCEDDERAIEDYLGAIVYTAALVLLRREK